ncbi:glycosyltransferase [Actinomadura sp. DC4]|uniref:glycosyltransferase family 2 protein n=1 Tax=Actinomadura sp. DC4 TaxID=3055069 RepID=UPI0025AF0694|nr:glycosyltransferase [Actinomadura sp. DC4]MDN3358670.1 glycosyltransferase [Actinomadura sp. DC4]
MDRLTVVIITRNRRAELSRTLGRLRALPASPAIVVVDNGSDDGTVAAVGAEHPDVRVVPLGRNRGAVGRNIGVHLARTPYVAFSDDDSWWEPGGLERAADLFDAHPRLGLIAARVLVGPDRVPDPVNALMAGSPLPAEPGQPGPSVLGFLACATVVRREAFLDAGGFSSLLFFVGEERLLAYDLAAAEWARCYVPEIVAVHEPSPHRPPSRQRRRAELRNTVLTMWMRRPGPVAFRETARMGAAAVRDGDARAALLAAAVRMPAALARRRPLPRAVESGIRRLAEETKAQCGVKDILGEA